jgi:LEA14-like dessication related protein
LRPLALLLAAVLLSVGCSTATPPRFNVLGVAERERTDEAVVLDFTIGAENRNEDALPLERATYTLSLDGQRVFEGQRLARVTIPRFGEQRLVLPVVVPADLVPSPASTGPARCATDSTGRSSTRRPGGSRSSSSM